MKKLTFCLLFSALLALLILQLREAPPVLPPPVPISELEKALATARQKPELAGTVIGLCLIDSKGTVVFEDNARSSFIPASTFKTLTTATALEVFGPEYRIHTQLKATAPITTGIIKGDLIIVGGADPMLSLQDLQAWAEDLKARGLLRISGRIIGDGRLLTGSLFDDFWNWGDIGNGYGSPISGLNLEHNRFATAFRPGLETTKPAEFLGTFPEVPGIEWVNQVTTSAPGSGDGVVIHGGERTPLIYLRGTVPLGAANFQVTGAVPDPELFTAHHLRRALIDAGIEVTGKATSASVLVQQEAPIPQASQFLIDHPSPPLLEIITSIHATSDNHETECLFRLLGLQSKQAPDLAIRDHWKTRGLDFQGLRMEDGCGLARADFVRPLDLALLQHLAGTGPQGPAYKASFLAEKDGSLRWKGGAMSGIRSYTGYVIGASGEEYTFALMINHFTDSKPIAEVRDEILTALRRY